MKREKVILLSILIFLTSSTILTQEQSQNSNLEDYQLRKIQASQIFDGLANSIFQTAKIAGAKTKKEKKEATLNLIGTVVQFAADATRKNKKQEDNTPEKKQDDDANNSENNTVTKSINMGHLEQILLLTSDKEKKAYIIKMLQSKHKTEEFLDELNSSLKNILIDELFE